MNATFTGELSTVLIRSGQPRRQKLPRRTVVLITEPSIPATSSPIDMLTAAAAAAGIPVTVAPGWPTTTTVARSYLRWVTLFLRRPRGLTVIDRGWWDQFVDPGRYRRPASSGRATAALSRLLPSADVCIWQLRNTDTTTPQGQQWKEVSPRTAHVVLPLLRSDADAQLESVVETLTEALFDDESQGRRLYPTSRRVRWVAWQRRHSRHTATTLAIYRPMKSSARLATKVARAQLLPGRSRIAEPAVVAIRRSLGSAVSFDSWAAFNGSKPGRRIVTLTDPDGLVLVAKTNVAGADHGLRNEMEWHRRISQETTRCFDVPELVSAETTGGFDLLITKVMKEPYQQPSMAQVVETCLNLQQLSPPVTHGDMSPWNLLNANGELQLIDWEHSEIADAPLRDLVHFVVSSMASLQQIDFPQAITDLTDPNGAAGSLGSRLGLSHRQVLDHVGLELTRFPPRSYLAITAGQLLDAIRSHNQ